MNNINNSKFSPSDSYGKAPSPVGIGYGEDGIGAPAPDTFIPKGWNQAVEMAVDTERLQSFLDGLNFEQNLAVIHISGSLFIFFSLFSIISIFYGDKLITFFDLENKYPKISKFIQLRRKFQQYYLLVEIGIIIFVLLIIIIINIIVFMSHMN